MTVWATTKRRSGEADYVVVGSGSSGAAVSARLAQAGYRVILIEAGKSDRVGFHKYFTEKPGMIAPMHFEPALERHFDWGYSSAPQAQLLDRRLPVTRGKVAGGSSSVNGMVYVRGNRANYDAWVTEGCKGWSATEVNEYFKKLEDYEGGADAYRGTGGPIKIGVSKSPQEATLQFIQATSDTLGVKILTDYNGAEQEGIGRMQQNVRDGVRYSSSRGYLSDLDPVGLEVQCEVLATKVTIRNGRALGVEVRDKDGTRRTIHAEPPRKSRRLPDLRQWSHDESIEVFPGAAGASGSDGGRACGGVRIAVGGDRVDLGEDGMYGRNAAALGAAERA